jgi:hypothetical protein
MPARRFDLAWCGFVWAAIADEQATARRPTWGLRSDAEPADADAEEVHVIDVDLCL